MSCDYKMCTDTSQTTLCASWFPAKKSLIFLEKHLRLLMLRLMDSHKALYSLAYAEIRKPFRDKTIQSQ
jgi:hypothetical protein